MRDFKCRIWDTKTNMYVLPTKLDMVVSPADGYAEFNDGEGRYELEQYTGYDTESGIEVYEGDIFRDPDDIDLEYVVKFDKATSAFLITNPYSSMQYKMEEAYMLTLMGHIHQNSGW